MSWACEVIAKGRLGLFLADRGKKAVRPEAVTAGLSQLPWLYTCAVYLTKDLQMAEELVQETYRQAYGRYNFRNQEGASCRVWLLTILRKTYLRRYRKRTGKPDQMKWSKLHQDFGSMVEHLSIAQFSVQEVEAAVKELPEENRLVLILVDMERLSYQEAATVMKCSIKRLRSLLSRGRLMLQLLLHGQAPRKVRVGERE